MVFAAKVDFGKGFGELGFADAGRAEKEESTDGPARMLDAGAGAAQGVGYGGYGFGLVYHAFVDELFEI